MADQPVPRAEGTEDKLRSVVGTSLFGESVMYRHLTAFKGKSRFGRGIWVGKSPWTDCHIVLTPGGAVESRTVKRIPDQFIGTDLVIVKGLPWNYSASGVLMKKTGLEGGPRWQLMRQKKMSWTRLRSR